MEKKFFALILIFIVSFIVCLDTSKVQAKPTNTNINGINIDKQYIKKNYSKTLKNNPQFIVIHDTDNRNSGADAKANRDYFATSKAKTSAHYVVDQDSIIQVLNDLLVGWHCGEVRNKNVGNRNSIGIELCVNKSNNFEKTLSNGIALTKYLMQKYNIPSSNVIRHHDVTGKTCPRIMIEDNPSMWANFKKAITSNSNDIITSYENFKDTTDLSVSSSKINSQAKIINVKSKLNVRNKASKNAHRIDSLSCNQTVYVLSTYNNWSKISYNKKGTNKAGYVSSDYIRLLS